MTGRARRQQRKRARYWRAWNGTTVRLFVRRMARGSGEFFIAPPNVVPEKVDGWRLKAWANR